MSASQKANIRRAWLAERLGNGKSDAENIQHCALLFRVSETTVKKDLAAIYDRWMEIDRELAPKHKAQFMELGLKILEEARSAANDPTTPANFGPVVAQFKTLAIISGALTEKPATVQIVDSKPSDQAMRDRIEKLKADPKIRERAMKIGLDLDNTEKPT